MTWCSLEPGVFPPPPLKKTPCGFQHSFDTFQPFLGGGKESGLWDQKVPCLEGIAMKGHPGLVFKPAKRFDTASHKDSHVDLYVPRDPMVRIHCNDYPNRPHFVCVGKNWLTSYYLLKTSQWFICKHFLFTAIDPQHEKKNIRMETRLLQSSSLLS